ncbi:hypothetical protein CFR73_10110 [Novacetimonas maltaceti]|uniref:Uncharacterized protein n=1 Tax=Novacetimonas maltaceti TaxID=1203393 RepID=A0A2S3W2C6_9PROT|nr:hypothetical protein [Novacetimonas maltaceti]POF62986.1 hypothetical protein KMAL_13610 [Novacetimonas maltaceti]PYD59759.1 hypothetical protein CFR73_10110 [Novacetimonas maltaceti]
MTRDKAKQKSALSADRLRTAVAACLLSYVVARLIVHDASCWHAPLPAEATALGQVIAIACLPVMVLACFGMRARHRGLVMLIVLGGLLALWPQVVP